MEIIINGNKHTVEIPKMIGKMQTKNPLQPGYVSINMLIMAKRREVHEKEMAKWMKENSTDVYQPKDDVLEEVVRMIDGIEKVMTVSF